MKKGKTFLFIAIAVLVLTSLAAGYFLLFPNKTSSPLASIKVPGVKLPVQLTLNPKCKFKDDDLCKYINKYSDMAKFDSGFSGKSITTDPKGKKTQSIWEMEGDGKSHFVTYDGEKETFNTIIIGESTYTKDQNDGKWWKYVATKDKNGANTNLFNPEDLKNRFQESMKDVEDKTTYKKAGKEQCGKLTCLKYQIVNPEFSDSKEFVYFDDREYLIRKMRIEMQDGSITETLFDYNKVAIKEPSPVKEGEPEFNMFFNMPTSEESSDGTMSDGFEIGDTMDQLLEQYTDPNVETAPAGE